MVRVYDSTMFQVDSIPYHDYTNEIHRNDQPGVWRISMGGGSLVTGVPFYAQPRQMLSPTGEFWSSAGGAAQLEVARWMPPRDTSLVIYSLRQPEPVTGSERDSAMTALSDGIAEQMGSRPTLDPSRVPSTKPPVYGLSLDDRDRLWARIAPPDPGATAYDVFGQDGRHAETVTLSFHVDAWIPPVVHGDTLWAVVTDDLDVQYVVRARLRRPGG
jgi:hypothetical protein